jgi:hypothetical protein
MMAVAHQVPGILSAEYKQRIQIRIVEGIFAAL